MENFHLPEEIVLNILLRLPIICFVRFRCVCKAWYSLLSDPIFMYKNLTFMDDDDDHHLQFLIKRCRMMTLHNYFSLISFHNLQYNSKRYLPFIKGIACNDLTITVVGCCNGFVCLTDRITKILLWNPLTNQTKVLPESPHFLAHSDIPIYEEFDVVRFEVGFLFDANANDYKVIKIYHMEEHRRIPANVVYLYSFRSDSWRKLDFSLWLYFSDILDRIPVNSDGKFYHWIGDIHTPLLWGEDDTVPCVILSFDMNLDLFQTTEIPYIMKYFKQDNIFLIGLFMLKDSVAIFATPQESFYNGEAPIFEISVLLRIGVRESWTKLISIGPIADVKTMLGPWKNGRLFLRTREGDLMVFNPFTKEILILPSNGIPAREIQIISYKRANVQLGAINIG